MVNYDTLVQMSPYLTALPGMGTHEITLRNFLTDETVGLSRQTLGILKSAKEPQAKRLLAQKHGQETIDTLVKDRLLVDSDSVWEQSNINYLEIEITAHCNWRCEYCPVSVDPKHKETMPMGLFDRIIEKATRHPGMKAVTINSYNEPTLDIHFEPRVRKIAESNLKLMLFTNGSMLTEAKVRLLKECGVLSFVQFNLPSLEEETFQRMTGSTQYAQTLMNIERACSAGLPVKFAIKGTREDQHKNLEMIRARFGSRAMEEIVVWETNDRAGVMKNKYAKSIDLQGALFGCERVLNWIHIGVHGECFLCCEDYYQRVVYGNIEDGEIGQIASGLPMQTLRKQVYGGAEAPKDFLCRKCYNMQEAQSIARILRGKPGS